MHDNPRLNISHRIVIIGAHSLTSTHYAPAKYARNYTSHIERHIEQIGMVHDIGNVPRKLSHEQRPRRSAAEHATACGRRMKILPFDREDTHEGDKRAHTRRIIIIMAWLWIRIVVIHMPWRT